MQHLTLTPTDTDLTQIHDDTLVDLLPQVSPEDLDERDLEGGDLAVHEDARQIQLHLEANVDLGQRDGRVRETEGH